MGSGKVAGEAAPARVPTQPGGDWQGGAAPCDLARDED